MGQKLRREEEEDPLCLCVRGERGENGEGERERDWGGGVNELSGKPQP